MRRSALRILALAIGLASQARAACLEGSGYMVK